MARRCHKDDDLQEGEVWGLMEENPKLISSTSSKATPRMMIPRKEGLISSKEYSKRSSAPLTIPTTTTPSRQMVFHGPSSWMHDGHHDDDDDDEIVPPHEYIAKRLARAQISSFSVCEGFGRKLKGRDLSEVRNDVLRKTGFLET